MEIEDQRCVQASLVMPIRSPVIFALDNEAITKPRGSSGGRRPTPCHSIPALALVVDPKLVQQHPNDLEFSWFQCTTVSSLTVTRERP